MKQVGEPFFGCVGRASACPKDSYGEALDILLIYLLIKHLLAKILLVVSKTVKMDLKQQYKLTNYYIFQQLYLNKLSGIRSNDNIEKYAVYQILEYIVQPKIIFNINLTTIIKIMSEHSLKSFVEKTSQDKTEKDYFEVEIPKMLEINLNNQAVWTKNGAMIGYTGNIKFEREGAFSGGVKKFLKKSMTGEGSKLMKAEGTGRLYVADKGKKVQLIHLDNESICVNGNDILAHDQSIDNDITMLKSISGMMSGGLFQVRLEGTGYVALTSHGDPVTLKITPDNPVFTDPNATVAWAGHLSPDLKSDVTFKSLMGRGSGEEFQMKFTGEGWVLIQPFEEIYYQQRV